MRKTPDHVDLLNMRHGNSCDDRGEALVGYALTVLLIGIVAMVGVANVGSETSESFSEIPQAFEAASGEDEPELTPQEKWDLAKDDYSSAIADAKAQYKADMASAKSEYQQRVKDNKSLPKADKKKANTDAKSDLNAAKSKAKSDQKASKNAAAVAKADAKAEWKASS